MKRYYHQVTPRYSCGSPAIVDHRTAVRVASAERSAYEDAMSGIFGHDQQRRAEVIGLRGIVERIKEAPNHEVPKPHRHGWLVHDLLTDERYWWPTEPGHYVLLACNHEGFTFAKIDRPYLVFCAGYLRRQCADRGSITHDGGGKVAHWLHGQWDFGHYAEPAERFALQYDWRSTVVADYSTV